MNNKIPFVDLHINYQSIKEEIDNSIQQVIKKSAFIGGTGNEFVISFENDFKSYLGANHVISCANGTDAIEIGLSALGIGLGDEVLVPSLTWISTAEAVVNVGAKPVFIDVNDIDNTIDASLIEQRITSKTKALIAVHLYGNPANINAIDKICKAHQIYFIEDCAQAHGAMYKEKKIGTYGDVSTFSFYPGKNLGAFGDAGAIVCKNEGVANIAQQISNHGQKAKHNHLRIGRNSRMDGIHAAVLSVKLKYIDVWNDLRISHANYYNQLINGNYQKPIFINDLKSVFHLYVIKTSQRDKVLKILNDKNISTGIHYPQSLSQMKIFEDNCNCPVSNKITSSVISLPMYPELERSTIEYVSQTLNAID